ncbi:MAG: hypothetical protein NTX22_13375 [Ignavibacteriales bacterium]|nr:hypothetical protein [Ignavibacteriales bacterium]
MKMDYIPTKDGSLDAHELTFVTKLPGITTLLGITAEETNNTLAIIASHRTAYADMNLKKAESKATVENNAAKKALAIAEIRRIAQKIKSSNGYTEAMGLELGIIGTAETGEDLETIKPTLKGKILGGSAVVSFDKQKMNGVKIYSKRGSEPDFTFLAVDTSSPYEDNRQKLNANLPEERLYYAYYLCDDQQVGQQSDMLKIVAP